MFRRKAQTQLPSGRFQLLSLPDDVLSAIAEQLAPSSHYEAVCSESLLSLSVTSHHMHKVVTPVLFNTVTSQGTAAQRLEGERLLLQSFLLNSSLSKHLRRVSLTMGVGSQPYLTVSLILSVCSSIESLSLLCGFSNGSLPSLITTAIQRLPRLEELDFQQNFTAIQDPAFQIGTHAPALKKLGLCAVPKSAPFQLGASLTHLTLLLSRESDAVQHQIGICVTALPTLKHLYLGRRTTEPLALPTSLAPAIRISKSPKPYELFAPFLTTLTLRKARLFSSGQPAKSLFALLSSLAGGSLQSIVLLDVITEDLEAARDAQWSNSRAESRLDSIKSLELTLDDRVFKLARADQKTTDYPLTKRILGGIASLLSCFPSLTHLTLLNFLTPSQRFVLDNLLDCDLALEHPVLSALLGDVTANTELKQIRIDSIKAIRSGKGERFTRETMRPV